MYALLLLSHAAVQAVVDDVVSRAVQYARVLQIISNGWLQSMWVHLTVHHLQTDGMSHNG